METDALSPSQRQALDQLQVLTDGGDVGAAISVLSSVGWNVERAADIIFDSHPSAPLSVSRPTPSPPRTPVTMEKLEIDRSEEDALLGGSNSNRSRRSSGSISTSSSFALSKPLRFILAIIAFPFQILRTIFRLLRIPLPHLPMTLSGLTIYYRNPMLGPRSDLKLDARGISERWLRALEEETGATRLSRRIGPAADEGSSSGVGASASSVTSRQSKGAAVEEGERILSDYFLGSYEEFARTCGKETNPKIGCVILVSEEHDDVAEFKRSTLADSTLVRLMHNNDFLVWGGDIRDRDAWSAAQKLQATTYPFVAFIAAQPRRGPSSRSSASSNSSNTTTPVLTILSRHQGPSIPAATAPTSAQTLIKHINDQVLPRVSPYLERVREEAFERTLAQAREIERRDRERTLRAEQDRAFEETQRRDRERIEKSIAEAKRKEHEAKRAEEKLAREAADAARREEERAEWEVKRMEWRRWGRRGLVPREPRPGVAEPQRGKTVRIGVRMPDGRRGVRFFGEGDSLTALFAFVDTMFIPSSNGGTPDGKDKEFSSDLDPLSPPDGKDAGESGLVEAVREYGKEPESWWGFKLASSYPRREIRWEAGRKLGEVDGLKGGGQLVVEILEVAFTSKGNGKGKGKGKARASATSGDEDDAYLTEESD